MADFEWTTGELAVLERRAEALAAPLVSRAATPALALEVQAGRRAFALPDEMIFGVRPSPRLTVVAGTSPPFVGLFSGSDGVLPAFSLMALVSPEPVPAERTYVIELGCGSVEVGLVVEDVRAFSPWTTTTTTTTTTPGAGPLQGVGSRVPVVGHTDDGIAVVDVATLLRGRDLHFSSSGGIEPEDASS